MVENKKVMANNIRRLMDERGLKDADMCRIFGFKHSTFSDWVNAKSYPRIDKIEMMANYFGVKKSDLVEEKENDYYVPHHLNREDDFFIIMNSKVNTKELVLAYIKASDSIKEAVRKLLEMED